MKRNITGNLLNVPDEQKQWFLERYEIIKSITDDSEFISSSMLLNNIFGINERLINYNSDNNGLIDDLLDNYINNTEVTSMLFTIIMCSLVEGESLEYYEIVNNIKVIMENTNKALFEYEEM